MTLFKPLWLQPAVGDTDLQYPASEFRQLIMGLAGSQARGVIAPTAAVVTHRAAGANFSVDIAAFSAIIDGGDVADQGSYLVTNTASYNLPTPSAPSSGTRTHRLVAQVRDKRANPTWTVYDWVPMIVQDTGGGEPALPASACTLAHISIAAGQANIQDSHITQGYSVLRDLTQRGPWVSNQAAAGAWNDTNTWHDYTSGQWPAVTFTVPPSGRVYVTISAALHAGTGSTRVSWRMSGANTVTHDATPEHGISTEATGIFRGSRRVLVTGLTPGGSNTITPQWWVWAGSSSDDGDGQLVVEAP